MTTMEPLAQVPVGSAQFSLHLGDVTSRLGAVPVVSSDDNYLSHSGGVSAAIWRAAGDGLGRDPNVLAAMRDGGRPRAGDVVVSRAAGSLVLHAVTLDFDRGERVTPERLMTLYQRVLDTAYDEGQSSVALPLLGTGTAGIAGDVSAVMLARAMTTRAILPLGLEVELWLLDDETLREVRPLVEDAKRPAVHFSALAAGHGADIEAAAAALDDTDRASLLNRTLALFGPLAGDAQEITDSDLRRTVRRAIEARNRLVSYSAPDADIPLVSDVLRACAALLAQENHEPDAESLRQPLSPSLRSVSHLTMAPSPLADAPPDRSGGHRGRLGIALSQAPDPEELAPERDVAAEGPGPEPTLAAGEVPAQPVPAASHPGLTLSDDLALELNAAAHNEAGTAHVRKLHTLLLEVLDDSTLNAEYDRLRALGYRGELSACLLESCAHENPLDVVMHLLSGQQLRLVLGALDVVHVPADPPKRLATRLLAHLGFPVPVDATDPDVLRTQMLVLRSEVGRLDRSGLTGRVASVSADVEQLLRHYVRFLCLGVLGEPPEAWLHRAYPDRPPSLDRMTLGQLARAATEIGSDIDASQDSTVRSRAVAVAGPRQGRGAWLPGQLHAAGRLRNTLVHGNDAEQSARALAELRDQTREFVRLVDKAMERLMDGAFPKVVVIEELTIDRWGRRRVSGRTPGGHHEEIFTDEALESGEIYLMRAQTNPLRVDPILVPAARDADEAVTA